VPEISRFLGIVITMYFEDHTPAHFHARYGSFRIKVGIADGIVEVKFPPRALAHVLEWRELRHAELDANWRQAQANRPLRPIEGLE